MMGKSILYYIEDKEVTQDQFNARIKTLKEIEHTWFCAETQVGGRTGYDATDGNGLIYEVRHDVDQKVSKSIIREKLKL